MLKTPQTYTAEHIWAKLYFLFLYLHYLQSYFGNCIFYFNFISVTHRYMQRRNEIIQKVLF